MKRSRAFNQHQISEVHIADGFYDDCDELLNRCLKYPTLDYQTFCNIWKDMNLGYLYQGRTSGTEIAELSEEVILIAKHYMLKDTSNFEESVAGLFLVYSLLTLQPYPGFAWLRITPEDVLALRRLEVVARRERRLDVLYILGDVLIRRSQYHAAVRERGMEKSYRKYLEDTARVQLLESHDSQQRQLIGFRGANADMLFAPRHAGRLLATRRGITPLSRTCSTRTQQGLSEGCTTVDRLGVRPKGVFYRQNEELDILRELGALTRQYVRAKNNVFGNVSNPSLNYIDEDLPDEMSSTLKNIINGLTEDPPENDDDGDESDTDHYQSVQAIKNRAMVNMVNPMKHLTAVEDRKIDTVKKHKSDLKTATGKVKHGSPTKPIPGSTTKRKKPKKQLPYKIKRLNFTNFETSDPESILPDVNDEDNNEVELNLEDFDKDKTLPEENNEDEKFNTDENTEVISENAEENYEIEINSLPVIIRTGCQGPSLEIEIFDEYKGEEITDKSTSEMESKPSTSKECDNREVITKKRIVKKTASLSEKLKKPERRDTKRNALKSKFNKMGMLPVANFE